MVTTKFCILLFIGILSISVLTQEYDDMEKMVQGMIEKAKAIEQESEMNLQLGESTLIKLDPRSNAKCLDGSPAAFYWRQGLVKDKFVIYFEGGGWCGSPYTVDLTVQNCLDRSQQYLGSSVNLTKTLTFSGILDSNPQNTVFWNYSTIFIHYCDGTGHQGFKEDPLSYNGKKIYFRGESNTKEILNYAMENLGLKSASQVIVSGGSAGGLAALTWVDFIADFVKAKSPNAKFYAIPDAGFFYDEMHTVQKTYAYRNNLKNFLSITSLETLPPNYACVKENQGQLWRCLLAQYSMQYIKTPVFLAQSPYDWFGINYILGINCTSPESLSLSNCNQADMDQINQFRDNIISIIDLYTSTKQGWGAWAPSCVEHSFTLALNTYNGKNYEVPQHSAVTLNFAISEWLKGKKSIYIDKKPWPSNSPCSFN